MIWWRGAIAALMLAWQGPVPPETPQPPEPVISVDVNLVLLHASVHDRKGRDVSDLKQSDFMLYEDGVRQDIRLFRHEDAPVTFALIIDHSGSMRTKLPDVTDAARLLGQASNPDDQIFVVNFNDLVFPGLPVDPHSKGPTGIDAAIGRVPAEGRTALYDAIASGLDLVAKGRWAKRVLVVISDGGDNASSHKLTDVTRLAEESSAVIYTIGIFDENDPEANPSVVRRLAGETGGEAFFPEKLGDTAKICDHIARDVRTQYMLGYVSGNRKQEGAFRSIRLVAESPGAGKLHVRTRSGYIASANPR